MADNPRKRSKSTAGSSSRAPSVPSPATNCPFRLASIEERTKYEKFRFLPIVPFKRLPRQLGLVSDNEIRRMIRVVGWDSLRNGEIAYRNLVLEFYTTLEIFAPTPTSPRSMRFRLFDKQYSLTDEALQRVFGVYGGGSQLLGDYTYTTAWDEISTGSDFGINDITFKPRLAKTTSLTDGNYQRFHKFFCANFGGKFEQNRVSCADLVVLHLMHHGEKVDLANYFFCTLPSYASRSGLTWGSFIMILARKLSGHDPLPADRLGNAFPPVDFSLRTMEVKAHLGAIPVPQDEPVQDDEDEEPEHPEEPVQQDQPPVYPPAGAHKMPGDFSLGPVLARLDAMHLRIEELHLTQLQQHTSTHNRLSALKGHFEHICRHNGWPLPPSAQPRDGDSD